MDMYSFYGIFWKIGKKVFHIQNSVFTTLITSLGPRRLGP